MRLADLQARLAQAGALPPHQRRLLRAWLSGRALDSAVPGGRPERFYPRRVLDALPQLRAELDALTRVVAAHPAGDGSERLLLALGDGQGVEAVLLPRNGLCVSTQAGCAVGCVFCATGREGLRRQLGSVEILAQVALARSRRTVRKVVFMGMGEPAHNLDNVLEAIAVLGSEGGIGHKHLVFSTVGDLRVFERLPRAPVRPALALSLHSTCAALRARLLPRAAALEPARLVELAEDYARATGYPIQYQWTLLEGINDTDAEMDTLVTLLRGRYAVMNLIACNPTGDARWRRPAPQRCLELLRRLNHGGVLATLRESAGQDVEGGCGQLRARHLLPQGAVVE